MESLSAFELADELNLSYLPKDKDFEIMKEYNKRYFEIRGPKRFIDVVRRVPDTPNIMPINNDVINTEEDNDKPLDFSLDTITIQESDDTINLWNVDGDNMDSGHLDIDSGIITLDLSDTYGATTTKLKDD